MPGDGRVFLRKHRAMQLTSCQPVVDCFATILTAAQNFLAMICLLSKFFDLLLNFTTARRSSQRVVNSVRQTWTQSVINCTQATVVGQTMLATVDV